MPSEVALDSVNSRIDLGGKAGKSLSVKNENRIGFRDLVSEKKENREKPAKQDAVADKPQQEKVPVKEAKESTAQKSSKEPADNSKENKADSNSAELEQAETMIEEIVQIDQQEVIVPQILEPEIVSVKVEESGLQEVEQFNVSLEDNFQPLENKPLISLKPGQLLADFSTEAKVVSGGNEITEEISEKSKNEIATGELNAQPVIAPVIQNDNNVLSPVKNPAKEAVTTQGYVEEEIKDNSSIKESEINFAEIEPGEEEALLAGLSSQNFKTEIKVAEQSKTNPVIAAGSGDGKLAGINKGEVEIAVKLEANKDIDISQNEVKIAKLAIDNNMNTIFADTSRSGQEILAAMRGEHKKNTSELMNEELALAATLPDLLEDVEIYTGLENNNNSNSKFAAEILSFGGTTQTNQDGKLVVSFKDNLVTRADNAPHRSEQIALSIKEAANSGKSNVTVNMYPKALGAIDIHIEFSVVGGKQVVESIKITAERRDTLDIIQKSEAELRKSLTEVTKSSEEASLEFNLKHNDGNGGRGAYFQDLEERQNWMNKFERQTDKVAEPNSGTGYSDENNYITEDSVNIII
jgi:hypothetical protein